MTLEALKPLRYPAHSGRDLKPGDRFQPLSDKDARVLTLTRVARQVEDRAMRPDETSAAGPSTHGGEEAAATAGVRKRGRSPRYLRSDMRAEE